MHSLASDGTMTPSDLVQRVHAAGVRVMALTDHDNTAGLAEASVQ
ncbi:MAG: PHP domain-containing protein, partial [Acidithiobacillus sp.]|nr:PHP domain-containing protein [Acidithiobacillus sp.]